MNEQRGYAAIVLVFLIGFIGALLSLTLLGSGYVESTAGRAAASSDQAFYAAQSGVEEAFNKILADSSYTTSSLPGGYLPLTIGGATVQIKVTGGTDTKTITVVGASGQYVRSIQTMTQSISTPIYFDIALVIDNSNSISSSEMTSMKNALKGFVNVFVGTPTEFSVTKFGTNASVVHGFTLTTADVISAINSVSTGGGGTNWKQGIIAARGTFDPRPDKPNLMIFVSDGNPTYPNCGGAHTCAADVTAAVTEANIAKSLPLNMSIVAFGIGNDLDIPNLQAISGPGVHTDTVLTSYVITTDFSGMASKLSELAHQIAGWKISGFSQK